MFDNNGQFTDKQDSPISKGILNIQKGVQRTAQRVCIYGPEGVGKSTLASKFPKPLFLDWEHGTNELEVDRLGIESFEHGKAVLNALLDEIEAKRFEYQTIVIDTIDWVEVRMREFLVADGGAKIKSIEDFGYHKGYTYLAEEIAKFLQNLDAFIEAGIHVVLLGHSTTKKCELPDQQGQYDVWTLDLYKEVLPTVKEWVGILLFINWQTKLIDKAGDRGGKDQNKKAVGGQKRMLFTSHTATYDAKNRHNLPSEIECDYTNIKHIFENAPASTKSTVSAPATSTVEPVIESTTESNNEPASSEASVIADLIASCKKGEQYMQDREVKGWTTDHGVQSYRVEYLDKTDFYSDGVTIEKLKAYLQFLEATADQVDNDTVPEAELPLPQRIENAEKFLREQRVRGFQDDNEIKQTRLAYIDKPTLGRVKAERLESYLNFLNYTVNQLEGVTA